MTCIIAQEMHAGYEIRAGACRPANSGPARPGSDRKEQYSLIPLLALCPSTKLLPVLFPIRTL